MLEYVIKCHFVDQILEYCSNICKICAGILGWFKVLVYPLILKSLRKVNGVTYRFFFVTEVVIMFSDGAVLFHW